MQNVQQPTPPEPPMISWPKTIKLGDAIDAIDTLDARITTLETTVARNDARITTLETYAAQIIAERTARIENLESTVAAQQTELRKQRWAMRTGRTP